MSARRERTVMGRQAIKFGFPMKRSTWFSIAVGTLLNIAFCFVVARVFSPSEPGSAFLILLVTVWGIGLLIHLKARLVKALIYYLGGKQQRIEATVDELVRLRMPAGASYQNAASEYFSQVANDEDESKDARLYAGTMIGILTVMPLYSGPLALVPWRSYAGKAPFLLFDRGWVAATRPMVSAERDAPRPAVAPSW
jgi:hypothetical protein